MKELLKKVVSLVGRHRWPVFGSTLTILAYHRVLPQSDERYCSSQPGMVVSPATLENNIVWVAKDFSFIRLSTWLEACRDGKPLKGKYCAITFDDGWRDNLQYALPILQKHRVPATVYCVADMMIEGGTYWPERLARLLHEAVRCEFGNDYQLRPAMTWIITACRSLDINWYTLSQRDLDLIIEAVKVYSDAEIVEFIELAKKDLGLEYQEYCEVMDVGQTREMLASGLIDVGSHTCGHIRFDETTPKATLRREIIESRLKLETALGVEVKTFCYPNGCHPPDSEELAGGHYLGACTLDPGWNSPKSDYSRLKRLSMHEGIAGKEYSFKAKLSGWL